MATRSRRGRTPARVAGRAGRRPAVSLHLISSAAELLDMHPQTLRKYERLGLVQPARTLGSMRVYREDELERLRLIKVMVDEAGINLAGVRRLLSIAEVALRLRPLLSPDRAARASDLHAQVAGELEEIFRILGLDPRL